MKKKLKIISISLLLVILAVKFIFLIINNKIIQEKAEKIIISQVEKHLGAQLKFEGLNFSIFPSYVELRQVKLSFGSGLKLSVKRIRAKPDVGAWTTTPILKEVELDDLIVVGEILPARAKPATPFVLAKFREQLITDLSQYLPIKWLRKIKINNAVIDLKFSDGLRVMLAGLSLSISAIKKVYYDIWIKSGSGSLSTAHGDYQLDRFHIKVKASRNRLLLTHLVVDLRDYIKLALTGQTRLTYLHLKSQQKFNVELNLNTLAKEFSLNGTGGYVLSEGKFDTQDLDIQTAKGEGQLRVIDGQLDDFLLHNTTLAFQLAKGNLSLLNGQVKTKSGQVFTSGRIGMKKPFTYALQARTEKLGFATLLRTFGVDQEDVHYDLTGPLALKGNFFPFSMSIKSDPEPLQAKQFYLPIIQQKRPQVAYYRPLKIWLNTDIDTDKMVFNHSQIIDRQHKIFVDGPLFFSKAGLNLAVYADRIPASLGNYFLGVDMKGPVNIRTRVFGPYQDVQVHSDFTGNEISIDDKEIGNIAGFLSYRKLGISFKDVNGQLGAMSYQIERLGLDLSADKIAFFSRGRINGVTEKLVGETLKGTSIKWPAKLQFKLGTTFDLRSPDIMDLNVFKGQVEASAEGVDWQSIHFDTAHTRIELQPGLINIPQLKLTGKRETSLSGAGSLKNLNALDWKFNIADLTLQDSESVVRSKLSAYVDLHGTVQNPVIKLEASLLENYLSEFKLDPMLLKLGWKENTLSFAGNDIKNFLRFSGFYKPEGENFSLKTTLSRYPFAKLVKSMGVSLTQIGDVSLNIDVNGNLKDASLFGYAKLAELHFIDGQLLKLKDTEILFQGQRWLVKPFEITGKHFLVSGFGQKGVDQRVQAKMVINSNLKVLGDVFRSVKNSEGNIVVNAGLSGKLDDMALNGTIDLQQGKVLIAKMYPSFSQMQLKASFNRNNITIKRFSARKGPGEIYLTGGIELKNLFPYYYHFDILANRTLNRITIPVLNSVDVMASGKLKVVGEKLPFLMTGDITLDKVLNSDELKWRSLVLDSLKRSVVRSAKTKEFLKLNVDVKANRSVRISNSLYQGVASCDLKISGDISDLKIKGQVFFPAGTLLLRSHKFRVLSGTMQMEEDVLQSDIYFQAVAKIDKYNVYVQITGKPQKLNIEFDAEPKTAPDGHVITDNDIITLISSGKLPERNITEGLSIEKASQVEAFNMVAGVFQNEITDKITALSYGLVDKIEVIFHYSSFTKGVVPRGVIRKQILDNLEINLTSDLSPSANAWESNLEYRFNPNISVQGEVNNTPLLEQGNDVVEVGGDIKFKFDFNY